MKKIVLCLMLCLMVMGCQSSPTDQSSDQNESWEGIYTRDNVTLEIFQVEEEYGEKSFFFEIEIDGQTIEDYAFLDSSNDHYALCDAEEDGHAFSFTLKNQRVTVEESGGITYLGINLSGVYQKQ